MNFHFHRIWSLRFTTGNDLSFYHVSNCSWNWLQVCQTPSRSTITASRPTHFIGMSRNLCVYGNTVSILGFPPTFIYFFSNRMLNSWLKYQNATKKGEVSNGLHPRLPPRNEPARCLRDREMAAYDSEFSTHCRNCLLLTSLGDMNKRKLTGIAQLGVSMLHLSDKLSNKLIRFVEGKTLMKQFTTPSWYLLSDSNVIL